MRITKKDFVKWSPELTQAFHIWEVMIPIGTVGNLRFRQETFAPGDYETPEEQYEAVCDLINGCRFSETEYYVFCDNRLVVNL